MSERNVVEFEPSQHRHENRGRYESQSRRVELNDIAANEVLVLATATARAFLDGWEMRARLKNRRIALMITGALVVALGIGQLVIQLIKS